MDTPLAQNVRKYRRAANITQDQLSALVDVGQSAISKWETGEADPSAPLLPRLACLMGVTLDQLMSGIDAAYDAARSGVKHKVMVPESQPLLKKLIRDVTSGVAAHRLAESDLLFLLDWVKQILLRTATPDGAAIPPSAAAKPIAPRKRVEAAVRRATSSAKAE